jgi:hypothetical protein
MFAVRRGLRNHREIKMSHTEIAPASGGAPASSSPSVRRQLGTRTPDQDFYQAFLAAHQRNAAASTAGADPAAAVQALQGELGEAQSDSFAMRGIDIATQRIYAEVLNRAYSSQAMANPRAFLQSLSPQALDAVRLSHSLAAPIRPGELSDEGAANLLLPVGYTVDLNHDGMEEIGAALTSHFPPRDAPAAFVDQWQAATAGMDDGELMTYSFQMYHAIYGFRIAGQPAPPPRLPSDQYASYVSAARLLLDNVALSRPYNTPARSEADQRFFTHLLAVLGA